MESASLAVGYCVGVKIVIERAASECQHVSEKTSAQPIETKNSVKARLINQDSGEVHDLAHGVSLLGRTRESTVKIADRMISRRHAMIRQQNDGFWYFDLGSFNGSYINGRRVVTSTILSHGDTLALGSFKFKYEQEGSPDTFSGTAEHLETVPQLKTGEAILLVSDIVGFTSLSEKLPPEQLAPVMGNWYSEIEKILSRYQANLDKFIGDCVFAYWTDASIENRIRAMQTANEIVKIADHIQQKQAAILDNAGLTFRLCASVHSGNVAYGGMSSSEFTLLGDAVNLVFRLESLTRKLDVPILLSGEFLASWPEGRSYCKPLGVHEVKGRAQVVDVYAPESFPPEQS